MENVALRVWIPVMCLCSLLVRGQEKPLVGPARFTVDCWWPEQEIVANLAHKVRPPRGGFLDLVVTCRPGSLANSQAQVRVRPLHTKVKLLECKIDDKSAKRSLVHRLLLTEKMEFRWRFKLAPWREASGTKDYEFEVQLEQQMSCQTKTIKIAQGFTCYDTTLMQQLDILKKTGFARVETLGQSQARRDILLMRLSDWSVDEGEKRPFLILGPQHGTEPSGMETLLEYSHRLTSTPEGREYLKKLVFYIVPTSNPDGLSAFKYNVIDLDKSFPVGKPVNTPEGKAVETVFERYGKQLKGAFAVIHHQWAKNWVLLSHMGLRQPSCLDESYQVVRNAAILYCNKYGRAIYPMYATGSPNYQGIRAWLSVKHKIPNVVIENSGAPMLDIRRVHSHIETELTLYQLLIDQFLTPGRVVPKPPPRATTKLSDAQTYLVKRVRQAPVIDGRLDEVCWAKTSKITNLRSRGGLGPRLWQTTFHILYDDKFLYIACQAPDLTASTITQKDSGSIWTQDGCEVFLDTNFNRWSYFQLMANANGALNMTYRATPGLNGQPKHAVAGCRVIGSVKHGAIEMAIPFSAFNGHPEMVDPKVGTPKSGTIWGANFVRNQHSKKGDAMWSRIPSGSSHRPWMFNAIKFE